MPGYEPLKTRYFDEPCNVLIRLNRHDTKRLAERMNEILAKDRGVNLILLNMKGAISITESDERGRQLKFIAFSDRTTFSPETEQRGYTGKWSHVEISISGKDGVGVLRKFTDGLEKPKGSDPNLDRWVRESDHSPRSSQENRSTA